MSPVKPISSSGGEVEEKLRVALIGTGNITLKAYLPVFHELREEIELVGAYDVNEDALRGFEKAVERLGFNPRIYPSLEELLGDEELDLVLICIPTHLHYQVAEEAIKARKHVMMEKPFARTYDQARQLLRLAEEKGVALLISQPRRFDPRFTALRREISSGALGELIYLRFYERANLPQVDAWRWHFELSGGVLLDVGVHYVYTLRWLLGEEYFSDVIPLVRWKCVSPIARKYNTPDWGEITFLGTPISSVEVSWVHPRGVADASVGIEAVGTKGKYFLWDLESASGWHLTHQGISKFHYSTLYSSSLLPFKEELKFMVNALKSGNLRATYELSEESAEAIRILEEAMKERE